MSAADVHWPIYKLSPPPKVQTERNLQNSRLNPGETGSPVDFRSRIPPKCAFCHAGDERIPKTEDSLAEGVGFEPTSDFRRCRFSRQGSRVSTCIGLGMCQAGPLSISAIHFSSHSR